MHPRAVGKTLMLLVLLYRNISDFIGCSCAPLSSPHPSPARPLACMPAANTLLSTGLQPCVYKHMHLNMHAAAAAAQVHNISDILGGFLCAIIFTTPFAIKAIGLHACIKHLVDGPAASNTDKVGRPTHPTGSITNQQPLRTFTPSTVRAPDGDGPVVVPVHGNGAMRR